MHAATEQAIYCGHCGNECEDHIIEKHEKLFCCEGCLTVYEILSENNLCEYYQIGEKPGISQIKKEHQKKYDVLDQDGIVQKFYTFQQESIVRVTFSVPSIHCSSCIWLLENLQKLHEGVIRVTVHFVRKEADILFDKSKITLGELAKLMHSIGYGPDISYTDLQSQRKKLIPSTLPIRLAVAGFCFGNSMLISIPEYLDNQNLINDTFKSFFGYLNLGLGLFTTLVAGQEYFIPAWKGLKKKFVGLDLPISIGILALFLRSAYEVISFTGPGYFDSLTGLLFFLLIGKWYQSKTYDALSFDKHYHSYLPLSVTVVKNNEETQKPINELKTGDEIVIHNEELIPADGILTEGQASINYSFVTGESVPVNKESGEMIYAGGKQLGSPIRLLLIKDINGSYLNKLWNQDIFNKEKKHSLASFSNQVAERFTYFVLGVSIIAAIFWGFYDSSKMVHVITSILIVACPCALALAFPFSLGHAARIMGKFGLYFKNTDVIESMAKTQEIVMDKTGTLTYTYPDQVSFQGKTCTDFEKQLIYTAVSGSLHPLSKIISKKLFKEGIKKASIKSYQEITGKGIEVFTENDHILIGNGAFIGVQQSVQTLGSTVHVKINDDYKGYFEFSTRYRDGISEMLETLHQKMHFPLHLLSGDNNHDQPYLEKYFDKLAFNCSPDDKLSYVSKLELDKNITMIGDGLNDAGALKQSKVGIVVCDELAQFSPASDAIIQAQSMHRLPQFFQLSQEAVTTVKQAFFISFLYNAVGLSFAISGHLSPLVSAILMPLSSVSVVGFITLMLAYKSRKIGLK